jgi:hypothetical protein
LPELFQQGEPGPGERQQGRIGEPRPAGQRRERGPAEEQSDHQFEDMHDFQ